MQKFRDLVSIPQAESKAIAGLGAALEAGNPELVKQLLQKIQGDNLATVKLDPLVMMAMNSAHSSAYLCDTVRAKQVDKACAYVLRAMTDQGIAHQLEQATVVKMVQAGASESLVRTMEGGFKTQPEPKWPMAKIMNESRKLQNGMDRIIDTFLSCQAVEQFLGRLPKSKALLPRCD